MNSAVRKPMHDIDLSEGIDELDEISGNEQLALVWCRVHETWEWHWLDEGSLLAAGSRIRR